MSHYRYEREYVRDKLPHYVDFDGMSLKQAYEEIGNILANLELSDEIKDDLHLIAYQDYDGYWEWRIVYNRLETDEEWSRRIQIEQVQDQAELVRLTEKLKGISVPDPSDVLWPGRKLTDREIKDAIAQAKSNNHRFDSALDDCDHRA